MNFHIRARKNVHEKQMIFQRKQSANELNEHQKLKQIFTKKLKNRKNIF